ncbi:hypothetical protein CTAYLR_004234 [Chrysophaeum taylorii]|uniref:VWFA domain-containing protein n=1 Tax=Chrysophaeum taylorii TaxID=2483200 RepID=A0AAD7UD68_9STRA|nr:hypothetical protein CTAYLR_004234 [Chrysophaeum taylorii]
MADQTGKVPDGQVIAVVNENEPVQVPLVERVRHMQQELDLTEDMIQDLLGIAGADIVVIADDSGSMACCSNPTAMNVTTRWEELKSTLRQLVTMLLVVDHSDGFDLQFLNDPNWYAINSLADVDNLFVHRFPRGGTPLYARCEPILNGTWHPKQDRDESDLILLVMTDGEPSDCSFEELKRAVARKRKNVYVTFLMCTDEDNVVAKYNRFMDRIPGVDVCDDYVSEKREVERRGRRLTYYKWLGKAVLGSKLPKYDKLDEATCGRCACVVQ